MHVYPASQHEWLRNAVVAVKRGSAAADPQALEAVFKETVAEYLAGPHDPGFVQSGHSVNPHRFVAVTAALARHLPPGGTLVDIGAGNGIVPRMMSKVGAGRVIEVDSEQGSRDLDYLAGTRIETVVATVGQDRVPLEDGVADVVFAGDVIEHLPHTPRHFMAEVVRLLKPGGWHVQDTPNAVSLRTRLKMLAGVPNWPTLDGIWWPEYNVHHHKEYTLTELVSLFDRSGFVDIEPSTYEQFWQRSLKRRGRLQTMGADLSEVSQFGEGFNFKHPYEYARIGFLAVSKAVPSLRSSLIVAGRKPSDGTPGA